LQKKKKKERKKGRKKKKAEGYDSLVVVDVELCLWVCGTSCFEGDPNKVFTKDIGEDTATKGTILVEDLIHDVLVLISNIALWNFVLWTQHTQA
jgi:hypothetical protein